jgi:two-component system, LytTR family, sensor kinase
MQPPPNKHTAIRDCVRVWRWSFPIAILFGLSGGIHEWFAQMHMSRRDPFWATAVSSCLLFAFWGAVAPVILDVMKRHPLDRKPLVRNISVQVGVFAFVTGIYVVYLWALNMFVIRFLGPNTFEYEPFLAFSRYALPLVVSNGVFRYYVPLLAIGYVVLYREAWRRQEVESADLSRQLAQAQLRALQARLEPHFLFNTLNSISAMIHQDPEGADRMLMQLSDLLRLTLAAPQQGRVTLSHELDYMSQYLAIEKVRFGSRLTVTLDVPAQALNYSVPFMLLQPIVENAVRHGISRIAGPGRIAIRARVLDEVLEIDVQDNGPGLNPGTQGRAGLGASSTEKRIKQLYGERASLELSSLPQGGTLAVIRIPADSAATATGEDPAEYVVLA